MCIRCATIVILVPSNLKRTYHQSFRTTLCLSVFVCVCVFFSLTLFRFVVQECTFQFKQMELLTNAMPALKKILCHRSTEEWMSPHTGLGALGNEKSRCAAPRVFTVRSLISQNNVDRERGCLWTESKNCQRLEQVFFFFSQQPGGAKRTLFDTRTVCTHPLEKLSPIFPNPGPCVQQSKSSHTEKSLRRGGAGVLPVSCCMCEPLETALSLGNDTHAVGTRMKGA